MEGALKRGHGLHCAVHAEGSLRVGIGERCARLRLKRAVLTPYLRESEEEALLRSEAVDGLPRLPLERFLVRAHGERCPAEVGDFFAGDEFAVDVDPRRDIALAVLVCYAVRAR